MNFKITFRGTAIYNLGPWWFHSSHSAFMVSQRWSLLCSVVSSGNLPGPLSAVRPAQSRCLVGRACFRHKSTVCYCTFLSGKTRVAYLKSVLPAHWRCILFPPSWILLSVHTSGPRDCTPCGGGTHMQHISVRFSSHPLLSLSTPSLCLLSLFPSEKDPCPISYYLSFICSLFTFWLSCVRETTWYLTCVSDLFHWTW